MYRFIETIQLRDGSLLNLDYHQDRLIRTYSDWYPGKKAFDIEELMQEYSLPARGKFRCTLYYNDREYMVKLAAYHPKNIKSLKLVDAGDRDYSYKFADRSWLGEMKKGLSENEEIVIIKNERITDASYANLVFRKGDRWYTPGEPLLKGTKRQKLIDEGEIIEVPVHESDLAKYSECSLINAMLDPGEIRVSTDKISW